MRALARSVRNNYNCAARHEVIDGTLRVLHIGHADGFAPNHRRFVAPRIRRRRCRIGRNARALLIREGGAATNLAPDSLYELSAL